MATAIGAEKLHAPDLDLFLRQYQTYGKPSPFDCKIESPAHASGHGATVSLLDHVYQLKGRMDTTAADLATIEGSIPIGSGVTIRTGGQEGPGPTVVKGLDHILDGFLDEEYAKYLRPRFLQAQDRIAQQRWSESSAAANRIKTSPLSAVTARDLESSKQALSSITTRLRTEPLWEQTAFLDAMAQLPSDSKWNNALAAQAQSLLDHRPPADLPQSDPDLHIYRTAVGALKTAVAASAEGAADLARQSYELSMLLETFREHPRGMSDLSGFISARKPLALAPALTGNDLTEGRVATNGEQLHAVLSALPDSPKKEDFDILAKALISAGTVRQDLLTVAMGLGGIQLPLSSLTADLDRFRSEAPYLFERAIRKDPQELPRMISEFENISKEELAKEENLKALTGIDYGAIHGILTQANAIALAADRTRNLLEIPRVRSHLSADALAALKEEVGRLEAIEREAIRFSHDETANGIFRKLLLETGSAMARIYDFTLGLQDAAKGQVYQLADLAKALWHDPGLMERGVIDAVTDPPATVSRLYDSYLGMIRRAQTAGDARALGEAYGTLAINTFLLADGATAITSVGLNALKASLAFQAMGEGLARYLDTSPEFIQFLQDESGELKLSQTDTIKTPNGDLAVSKLRHDIEQFYQSDTWTPGITGNAIDNILDHYAKHTAKFPELKTVRDYYDAALGITKNRTEDMQFRLRRNGDLLIYDSKADRLVVVDANGAVRTMFRPDPGYWASRTERSIDLATALKHK